MYTEDILDKATAREWKIVRRTDCQVIETAEGSRIVTLGDHVDCRSKLCGNIDAQDKSQQEIDANAALIVRAVNSFKAMRETVFLVAAYIDATHGYPSSEQLTDMLTHAKVALALSEKGK